MEVWTLRIVEPTLDELLADEIMVLVTRSAGTDRARLRALLRDVAGRLPVERFAAVTPRCASEAGFGCWPPAA
jgi:hypothetical protein